MAADGQGGFSVRISNKRRFGAFLVLVAVVLLAAVITPMWYFRPIALIDQLARSVDLEQLQQAQLTTVAQGGPVRADLTDPTAIRACLAALEGAQVRRKLFADGVREALPGQSFLLRLTDAQGREAVLDIAGRSIVLNLNTGFELVEPADLSALGRAMG